MRIKEILKTDKHIRRLYKYYRKLGYTEYVSFVLAYFTYGDNQTSNFLRTFPDKQFFECVYKWLSEHDVNTKEEAFEKRVPVVERVRKKGSAVFSGLLSKCSSASQPVCGSAKWNGGERSAMYSLTSGMHPSSEASFSGAACKAMPADGETGSLNMVSFAEMIATDAYEPIEEKNEKNVFSSPSSTFRMTTNTASVGVLLNQIRNGRSVHMSEVRIEELMNYFRYHAELPEEETFRITTEIKEKGEDKCLLYIHAQAKEEIKEHQNIVLLLDVSGSMCFNAENTQSMIATVVSKLHKGDCFSLVTYSSNDRTVFDGYNVECEEDKEHILSGILKSVLIEGCTFGSAGIETAYEIGAKYYHEDWNNQVILITDGDLNFGVTEKDGLEKLIEEKKKTGLFLSVIGTGLYNYKDDKLETLSKHGNGVYRVVNDLRDVKESVNRRYASLTNVVAKDVKAQVEFNPKLVKSYRLLGYENRELSHDDFKNDKVISEPYGSGGYGVALYELVMGESESDLKYQKVACENTDELCTVKIRYKHPLDDVSEEIEKVVKTGETSTSNTDLAYFLYCISEKLRNSDKLDEADEEFFAEMKKNYKEAFPENKKELGVLVSAID